MGHEARATELCMQKEVYVNAQILVSLEPERDATMMTVLILANQKYFFAGQNPTFCRTFLVFAGHSRSFQNIPQILLALHLKHTKFYHFISKCKTQILQDT